MYIIISSIIYRRLRRLIVGRSFPTTTPRPDLVINVGALSKRIFLPFSTVASKAPTRTTIFSGAWPRLKMVSFGVPFFLGASSGAWRSISTCPRFPFLMSSGEGGLASTHTGSPPSSPCCQRTSPGFSGVPSTDTISAKSSVPLALPVLAGDGDPGLGDPGLGLAGDGDPGLGDPGLGDDGFADAEPGLTAFDATLLSAADEGELKVETTLRTGADFEGDMVDGVLDDGMDLEILAIVDAEGILGEMGLGDPTEIALDADRIASATEGEIRAADFIPGLNIEICGLIPDIRALADAALLPGLNSQPKKDEESLASSSSVSGS